MTTVTTYICDGCGKELPDRSFIWLNSGGVSFMPIYTIQVHDWDCMKLYADKRKAES